MWDRGSEVLGLEDSGFLILGVSVQPFKIAVHQNTCFSSPMKLRGLKRVSIIQLSINPPKAGKTLNLEP